MNGHIGAELSKTGRLGARQALGKRYRVLAGQSFALGDVVQHRFGTGNNKISFENLVSKLIPPKLR